MVSFIPWPVTLQLYLPLAPPVSADSDSPFPLPALVCPANMTFEFCDFDPVLTYFLARSPWLANSTELFSHSSTRYERAVCCCLTAVWSSILLKQNNRKYSDGNGRWAQRCSSVLIPPLHPCSLSAPTAEKRFLCFYWACPTSSQSLDWLCL